MRIPELQKQDVQAQKIRAKKLKVWKEINGVLYYQALFYISKIIRTQLINRYYNDFLAKHFGIKKT